MNEGRICCHGQLSHPGSFGNQDLLKWFRPADLLLFVCFCWGELLNPLAILSVSAEESVGEILCGLLFGDLTPSHLWSSEFGVLLPIKSWLFHFPEVQCGLDFLEVVNQTFTRVAQIWWALFQIRISYSILNSQYILFYIYFKSEFRICFPSFF